MPEPAPPAIRPATPQDVPQINALLNDVWFPPRSPAGYDWLFSGNPGQSGLPPGWVLQDGAGRVRAFLGNFVQKAWLHDAPLLVASGHSFVAAPEHGARALGLLRTFLRQDAPILLSGMNSNPVSARIYNAMRLSVYPQTGAEKLSWITNPLVAATGAISWRLHGLAAHRYDRRIPDIRRNPPNIDAALARQGGGAARIASPATDPRLARFDARLRAGPRLWTERSPEALAWRLADPDADVPPVLLAWPDTGHIRGLALVQFNKPSEAEPPYLDLVDLVTLDPADGAAAQALTSAALALARTGGAARLRLAMVTPQLRSLLGPLALRARRSVSDAPHAFYKARADAPQPIDRVWHPLPYDGDNGPSLRPLPVRKA